MKSIKKLIELGWDNEYPTGKLLKQCELELDGLLECKNALEKIKDEEGKVCKTYEICNHTACHSSYNAWAIADEVLVNLNDILFHVMIEEDRGA